MQYYLDVLIVDDNGGQWSTLEILYSQKYESDKTRKKCVERASKNKQLKMDSSTSVTRENSAF